MNFGMIQNLTSAMLRSLTVNILSSITKQLHKFGSNVDESIFIGSQQLLKLTGFITKEI